MSPFLFGLNPVMNSILYKFLTFVKGELYWVLKKIKKVFFIVRGHILTLTKLQKLFLLYLLFSGVIPLVLVLFFWLFIFSLAIYFSAAVLESIVNRKDLGKNGLKKNFKISALIKDKLYNSWLYLLRSIWSLVQLILGLISVRWWWAKIVAAFNPMDAYLRNEAEKAFKNEEVWFAYLDNLPKRTDKFIRSLKHDWRYVHKARLKENYKAIKSIRYVRFYRNFPKIGLMPIFMGHWYAVILSIKRLPGDKWFWFYFFKFYFYRLWLLSQITTGLNFVYYLSIRIQRFVFLLAHNIFMRFKLIKENKELIILIKGLLNLGLFHFYLKAKLKKVLVCGLRIKFIKNLILFSLPPLMENLFLVKFARVLFI